MTPPVISKTTAAVREGDNMHFNPEELAFIERCAQEAKD